MPGLRVAFFTHDTFGLGHVRRTVRIMSALARREPESALLLVTGSPAVSGAEFPANADYIKVPTTVKTGARGNQPPHLPIPPAERAGLRADLIREAVVGFAPDVFVIDNFPLGSQGELLPTLRALRSSPTRVVLGLRDVLDAPETVREDWGRQGVYEALHRYFHRVLVYGMPQIMDVADAYELTGPLAAKLSYCGYVTDTDAPRLPVQQLRHGIDDGSPLLVATGGGGGDAFPLLDLFLQALEHLPHAAAVVVSGPLMGARDRRRLVERAAGRPEVTILHSTPDLPSYFAAADVVVSMCGYNSALEVAVAGARAVVVPRTWRYGEHQRRARTSVEWEQLLRARALAALGIVHLVEPDAATPASLAAMIGVALAEPVNGRHGVLDVHGAEQAANHILDLAGTRSGT